MEVLYFPGSKPTELHLSSFPCIVTSLLTKDPSSLPHLPWDLPLSLKGSPSHSFACFGRQYRLLYTSFLALRLGFAEVFYQPFQLLAKKNLYYWG